MRQDLVVLAQQLQDAEERALDALKGHRTDDTKSAGMVGRHTRPDGPPTGRHKPLMQTDTG